MAANRMPPQSFKSEADALRRVKVHKRMKGAARGPGDPTVDRVEDEDTVYKDLANQAMLELLHSDRFRAQYDNITSVFHHGAAEEKPAMVPVEILQAVEQRERVASVKCASFKSLAAQKQARVEELEKELQEALSRVAKLEGTVAQLKTENASQKQRIEGDKVHIDKLVADITELRTEKDDAVDTLRQTTNRLEALEQVYEDLKEEFSEHTEKYANTSSDLEELKKAHQTMTSKAKTLEGRLKASMDLNSELTEKVSALNTQVEQAKEQLEVITKARNRSRYGKGPDGKVAVPGFVVGYAARENVTMAAHDVDAVAAREATAALKYVQGPRGKMKVFADIECVTLPVITKKSPDYNILDDLKDIRRFAEKQRKLGGGVEAEDLDLLHEAAGFNERWQAHVVEMVRADLGNALGVLSAPSLPHALDKALERRVEGVGFAVALGAGMNLRYLRKLLEDRANREAQRVLNQRHFKGGPCGVVTKTANAAVNTVKPPTVAVGVQYQPTTRSVAVGKNQPGAKTADEELQFELGLDRLAKGIRASLAIADVREQGFPVGLRAGSRKEGLPLMHAAVAGLDQLQQRLLALLRGGRMPHKELDVANADGIHTAAIALNTERPAWLGEAAGATRLRDLVVRATPPPADLQPPGGSPHADPEKPLVIFGSGADADDNGTRPSSPRANDGTAGKFAGDAAQRVSKLSQAMAALAAGQRDVSVTPRLGALEAPGSPKTGEDAGGRKTAALFGRAGRAVNALASQLRKTPQERSVSPPSIPRADLESPVIPGRTGASPPSAGGVARPREPLVPPPRQGPSIGNVRRMNLSAFASLSSPVQGDPPPVETADTAMQTDPWPAQGLPGPPHPAGAAGAFIMTPAGPMPIAVEPPSPPAPAPAPQPGSPQAVATPASAADTAQPSSSPLGAPSPRKRVVSSVGSLGPSAMRRGSSRAVGQRSSVTNKDFQWSSAQKGRQVHDVTQGAIDAVMREEAQHAAAAKAASDMEALRRLSVPEDLPNARKIHKQLQAALAHASGGDLYAAAAAAAAAFFPQAAPGQAVQQPVLLYGNGQQPPPLVPAPPQDSVAPGAFSATPVTDALVPSTVGTPTDAAHVLSTQYSATPISHSGVPAQPPHVGSARSAFVHTPATPNVATPQCSDPTGAVLPRAAAPGVPLLDTAGGDAAAAHYGPRPPGPVFTPPVHPVPQPALPRRQSAAHIPPPPEGFVGTGPHGAPVATGETLLDSGLLLGSGIVPAAAPAADASGPPQAERQQSGARLERDPRALPYDHPWRAGQQPSSTDLGMSVSQVSVPDPAALPSAPLPRERPPQPPPATPPAVRAARNHASTPPENRPAATTRRAHKRADPPLRAIAVASGLRARVPAERAHSSPVDDTHSGTPSPCPSTPPPGPLLPIAPTPISMAYPDLAPELSHDPSQHYMPPAVALPKDVTEDDDVEASVLPNIFAPVGTGVPVAGESPAAAPPVHAAAQVVTVPPLPAITPGGRRTGDAVYDTAVDGEEGSVSDNGSYTDSGSVCSDRSWEKGRKPRRESQMRDAEQNTDESYVQKRRRRRKKLGSEEAVAS